MRRQEKLATSLFACGAFYTLISDFIFERRQDLNHQPAPYPLKSHTPIEA